VPTRTEDAAAAAELAASAKDRAENVMIVDLLRNDFGRVCETGSVEVRGLWRAESFATVHHLVSTVTGTLAPEATRSTSSPPVSPADRSPARPSAARMEIIDELEPHRREVYCGAIGYVAPGGAPRHEHPIRTTLVAKGELRFYAGGGIVADSTPEDEFDGDPRTKIAGHPPRVRPRSGIKGRGRMDEKAGLMRVAPRLTTRRDAFPPRKTGARRIAAALTERPGGPPPVRRGALGARDDEHRQRVEARARSSSARRSTARRSCCRGSPRRGPAPRAPSVGDLATTSCGGVGHPGARSARCPAVPLGGRLRRDPGAARDSGGYRSAMAPVFR
jgi:hypothetical protein